MAEQQAGQDERCKHCKLGRREDGLHGTAATHAEDVHG